MPDVSVSVGSVVDSPGAQPATTNAVTVIPAARRATRQRRRNFFVSSTFGT
jgi:hypothetical protein